MRFSIHVYNNLKSITMVEKIFFQASMPRAGSELLQTIMNSRPDVYASVTDPSLEYLFGARANYSTTPEVQAQDS